MAASTHKVILFSRVTVDKKVHQWPTAVFNDHGDAKSYATLLSVAHKSGNVEMAKAMDTKTPVADDGTLVAGLRFSIVEVPYSPKGNLGVTDMLDNPEEPTS